MLIILEFGARVANLQCLGCFHGHQQLMQLYPPLSLPSMDGIGWPHPFLFTLLRARSSSEVWFFLLFLFGISFHMLLWFNYPFIAFQFQSSSWFRVYCRTLSKNLVSSKEVILRRAVCKVLLKMTSCISIRSFA